MNKFKPRPYQKGIINSIQNKGCRNNIAVWPRRAGKDIVAWNICLNELVKKTTTIYFVVPHYRVGRMSLWREIFESELYAIPEELIEDKNDNSLEILFKNGSFFKIISPGQFKDIEVTDNTIPYGLVFSELALISTEDYVQFTDLFYNVNCWRLIVSTARDANNKNGETNILYMIYEFAKEDPNWHVSKLTVEDTKHIPLEAIQDEK